MKVIIQNMEDYKKLDHQGKRILFFDGVCNLCNTFVSFLVERNVNRQIVFASLQGTTAENKLTPELINNLETVVLLEEDDIYTKSEAAIRVLASLGGAWRAFKLLLIIPRVFRDAVYMSISRNRYHLFGKKETCRIPSAEEREMFLN